MKLIKLSANKASFHTVFFHKGLNLIVGKKENPNDPNVKNTYNGVGKSLSIELIHFCLGSDTNVEFKEKLNDWEFKLEFDIEGESSTVSRKCSEQDVVLYNDVEMKINDFRKILEKELFFIEEKKQYLSFRSLISRFIRRGKENYSNYFQFVSGEKPFQRLLNTGYLLGLNTDIIQKKLDLKNHLDNIKSTKVTVEKDEVIRQFFNNDSKKSAEINIEIKDLQEKIEKMDADLAVFKVADNYYKIQEDANQFKNKLQDCENQIILLRNDLDSINRSLDIKLDVSKEAIFALYKEVKFEMPEKITKKINDVLSFHEKLTVSRIKRLNDEKIKIQEDVKDKIILKNKLGKSLDESLKYLGEHGALGDFIVLNEQLSQFKSGLKKLVDYKNLLQEYKDKIESLKIEFSQENIKTFRYLDENKAVIDKNIDLFRSFSKEFYEDKPGGIDITNNEGVNQIRFDIKVKIEDDTSDGINEVKIFCFDFTLLLASFNHKVGFVIHDSRLFSNMDPRQRATLFRIAYEYSNEYDRQYIATINEDNLQPLSDYYDKERIKSITQDSRILELTDKSPESKLLGIQVDLEY